MMLFRVLQANAMYRKGENPRAMFCQDCCRHTQSIVAWMRTTGAERLCAMFSRLVMPMRSVNALPGSYGWRSRPCLRLPPQPSLEPAARDTSAARPSVSPQSFLKSAGSAPMFETADGRRLSVRAALLPHRHRHLRVNGFLLALATHQHPQPFAVGGPDGSPSCAANLLMEVQLAFG